MPKAPRRLKWLLAAGDARRTEKAENNSPSSRLAEQLRNEEQNNTQARQQSAAEAAQGSDNNEEREEPREPINVFKPLTQRVEAPPTSLMRPGQKMTAKEAGWLGTSLQAGGEYTLPESEADAAVNIPVNSELQMGRIFRLCWFRDMIIDAVKVAELANPNGDDNSYRTALARKNLQDLAGTLQRECFLAKDTIKFVRSTILNYEDKKPAEAAHFNGLSSQEQRAVFLRAITPGGKEVATMLRPLRQTIDIPRILVDPIFKRYVQDLFLTNCMSLYLNTHWDAPDVDGEFVVDGKHVYADIRPIPNRHQLPDISEIFVPFIVGETRIQVHGQDLTDSKD
ncbi:unnamed protein product [Periconia digitata]|uniref:Uncharacterized protein n=1 Tax=Periconia digitata TaxID=1303443 RepID=A0A9W4XRA2_9PLEO|nr:unnamed protein product [Periconia digitata]